MRGGTEGTDRKGITMEVIVLFLTIGLIAKVLEVVLPYVFWIGLIVLLIYIVYRIVGSCSEKAKAREARERARKQEEISSLLADLDRIELMSEQELLANHMALYLGESAAIRQMRRNGRRYRINQYEPIIEMVRRHHPKCTEGIFEDDDQFDDDLELLKRRLNEEMGW